MSGGRVLIAERLAVTLLRFVAGMGILRRSTSRSYWLGRARFSTAGLVVGCRLGTRLRSSSNPSSVPQATALAA
jgi:hypothetical protein